MSKSFEVPKQQKATNSVYLEPSDITQMEEATSYLRDKLLIRLLFHLGCRVSEALALTIEDIDLVNNQVTIIHLKRRLKLLCPICQSRLGKAHQFCPICGNKIDAASMQEQQHQRMRKLPIDSETVTKLREYIEGGGPVLKNDKKYIFGINRHRAWQIVSECAGRARLPQLVNPESGKIHSVSPHSLRNAFAIHAVKLNDSGDGLRLLQEHLGHASFDTTAKYRKVAGEEQREWYDKLWKEKE